MGCLGVHFALTEDEVQPVIEEMFTEGLPDVLEEIEERWDKKWLQETDKAWDAIHRCLTDGKLEYGETPLHKVILGKENINEADSRLAGLLQPQEVKEVAAAIKDIDNVWMRKRYFAIDPDEYGFPVSEADFEYTWDWFVPLKKFFQKAAKANRWVLFTADQ